MVDAVRNGKVYWRGALDEYLKTFVANFESLRIQRTKDDEFDDLVVASIEDFKPVRDEYVSVLGAVIQYVDMGDHSGRLHRFFEDLIPYLSRPANVTGWYDSDFDNFKFMVHELFLYSLAQLLLAEQFACASYILAQPYYVGRLAEYGKDATQGHNVFCDHMRSLDDRNQRLGRRRLSLRADLLKERASNAAIHFRSLMQADFLCFLRSEVTPTDSFGWFPYTLLYSGREHGPFELFARCRSRAYLASVLPLLGITDLAPIQTRLQEYATGQRSLPKWEFDSIRPAALLGADQLGTIP